MTKTAFIGLGVMGFPMAGHLRAKGHEVAVFNRNASRAEAWVAQHGGADKTGRRAASPAEAARNADFVFICVGNDADVRAVTYGTDGVLAGMAKGAVLVDHTTASAEVAREIAERTKGQGVGFLDAPVSGGQAGAQNGKLTVMVGGEVADRKSVV